MKKLLVVIFIFSFISGTAQEPAPLIAGTYDGSNLFFKNQKDPTLLSYIKEYNLTANKKSKRDTSCSYYSGKYNLSVNKKFDTVFSFTDCKETFELRLDKYYFKIGDTVIVDVSAIPELQVTIDDPNALRAFTQSKFNVLKMSAAEDGHIVWMVNDDPTIAFYWVEQFKWNKWYRLGKVNASGTNGTNMYTFQVNCHSGENQVRITDGFGRYSKPFKFLSNKPEVTMPGCHDNLVFSGETMYEVYDKEGKIVLTGKGSKIDISPLKPYVYYLNYDNKTTEFIKKK
jgi:hypothetical protein